MNGGPTRGLGHVILGVKDAAASLAFYRDVVGLPVLSAGAEGAMLSAGPVVLLLRQVAGLGPAGDERRVELVLSVDDVDAAHADLARRGAPFRVAPREVAPGRFAADFRDPDGHVLSIFGARAARGA